MNRGIIRKTVAALVVSAAATAGMSGVAFATKNTGKFQQSAEAKKQQCDSLWNQFERAVNDAKKADQAGNTQLRNDLLDVAEVAYSEGQKAGC
jgi:hypothetical protein